MVHTFLCGYYLVCSTRFVSPLSPLSSRKLHSLMTRVYVGSQWSCSLLQLTCDFSGVPEMIGKGQQTRFLPYPSIVWDSMGRL